VKECYKQQIQTVVGDDMVTTFQTEKYPLLFLDFFRRNCGQYVEQISDVKRGQILEAKAKAEDNFLSPLITYKKSSLATTSHHFNLSSLLSS